MSACHTFLSCREPLRHFASRQLKKRDAGALPDLYLAAMQHAFQRSARLAAEGDSSGAHAEQLAFVALCSKVAVSYMGFNASAPSLERIAAGGIRFALQAVHQNLPFMEVSAPLI